MARPDNPLFLEAWRKLYGYKYNDKSPEHVQELMESKRRVAAEQGDNFFVWVLDQPGTEYRLRLGFRSASRCTHCELSRWTPERTNCQR